MILAYKHWNFWKIQKKDRKMDRAHPILNEKDFSIFTKSVCEAKIAKKINMIGKQRQQIIEWIKPSSGQKVKLAFVKTGEHKIKLNMNFAGHISQQSSWNRRTQKPSRIWTFKFLKNQKSVILSSSDQNQWTLSNLHDIEQQQQQIMMFFEQTIIW